MNPQVNVKVLKAVLVVAVTVLLTSCLSSGGDGDASTSVGGGATPPPAGTCASVTYEAPSGAANNIVFTFDKAYTCGQFANGDWWVSRDSSPFVTITAITPTSTGGKHGYQVNPTTTGAQPFDNTSDAVYDPTLMPALPLPLTGISSVLKTVSYTGPSTAPAQISRLQFAAVLTIVDTPIVNSSTVFRPGYFGLSASKSYYAVPSAATVAGAKVGFYTPVGVSVASVTIPAIVNRFKNVQLDHYLGWPGRQLHPRDNMAEYGPEIASDNAIYLLRMLLSDFNYSDSSHKQALINYLQMAIDLSSMAANGAVWDADGGHTNGRKIPLQFADLIFGGADFSGAIAASRFSEDQQVWRSGVTFEVLWGKPHLIDLELDYWKGTRIALGEILAGGVSKDVRDSYGRIDGGSGDEIGVGYQLLTSMPWKYSVLALYMLGIETIPTAIPTPANITPTQILAEYAERWVRYGVKSKDLTTNINMTTNVITSVPHIPATCARPVIPAVPPGVVTVIYGTHYGPDGLGSCILGANNWGAVDNTSVNSGQYFSTFGDELWDWYH